MNSSIRTDIARWEVPELSGCADLGRGRRSALARLEEGSTTVEYAIGAIATAGFAGLLVAVLKSGGVKSLITSIIESALSF